MMALTYPPQKWARFVGLQHPRAISCGVVFICVLQIALARPDRIINEVLRFERARRNNECGSKCSPSSVCVCVISAI